MALTEKRDMFGAMVANVRKDGSHNGWLGSFEMGAVAWSGRLVHSAIRFRRARLE